MSRDSAAAIEMITLGDGGASLAPMDVAERQRVAENVSAFERELPERSLAADETSRGASPQLMYLVTSQFTALVAQNLVTSYLITVTDQLMLTFTAALQAVVVITMLIELILAIFHPKDVPRVTYVWTGTGTYIWTILFFLKIVFFIALYTAFNLLLALFSSLFLINAQNVVIAMMMLVVNIFLLLAFIAHPSINLITHLSLLIDPVRGAQKE